jgi:hypothetical protein
MRRHRQRFAIRFLISAAVAAATPALAAGVVVGVSAAATTVADVTQPGIPDVQANNAGINGRIATHGPARLSVLVGNGDLADQNAGDAPVAPTAGR